MTGADVVGDGKRSCGPVGEDGFLMKGTSVDLTAQGDPVFLAEGPLDLRSIEPWWEEGYVLVIVALAAGRKPKGNDAIELSLIHI